MAAESTESPTFCGTAIRPSIGGAHERTNERTKRNLPTSPVGRDRARKLAYVAIRGILAPERPATTEELCATATTPSFRVSPRTIRAWSEVDHDTGQGLLDFVHGFRAVLEAHDAGSRFSIGLDFAEPRAVARFLARGGLSDFDRLPAPSVETFCRQQRFVTNARVVDRIVRWWQEGGEPHQAGG